MLQSRLEARVRHDPLRDSRLGYPSPSEAQRQSPGLRGRRPEAEAPFPSKIPRKPLPPQRSFCDQDSAGEMRRESSALQSLVLRGTSEHAGRIFLCYNFPRSLFSGDGEPEPPSPRKHHARPWLKIQHPTERVYTGLRARGVVITLCHPRRKHSSWPAPSPLSLC
jgi:hypothetical protein